MEKKYKTIATEKRTGERIIIEMEHISKNAFISDLRNNGYKVNDKKVRLADEWDWIMDNTDCCEWDWERKRNEMNLD